MEELADMRIEERRRHFEPRRAEVVVAGAVILEAAVRHLRLERVTSVDTGLRNGILVDLLRRRAASASDRSVAEAALALGRRFGFDERHSLRVGALAPRLFDDLAPLHGLPLAARRILEAASILHDIGVAVSFHRHHKHTFYMVANADIPGLSDRERELVATVPAITAAPRRTGTARTWRTSRARRWGCCASWRRCCASPTRSTPPTGSV